MKGRLAFYVGSADSFNIRNLVGNLGDILNPEFSIDLITTNPDSFTHSDFKLYGGGENTRVNELKIIINYLRYESPHVLTQLTQPPIHGTILSPISVLDDVKFVYRYNGDVFNEYRLKNGAGKIRDYILYNGIGQTPIHIANYCIVMGSNGQQQLVKRGVSPEKTIVIPPMVCKERFQNLNNKPLRDYETQKVIGFVGRISEYKGVNTLESAIVEVINKRPNLKFVLVGPVEDKSIVQKYPDHVELIGPVSPEEIPDYMSSFDLLVHPSLTEGVPRVIIESLCAGTPVIARDVGDVSEVTKNTFENTEDFVDLLIDFESVKTDSIQKFTKEHTGKKYRTLYKKAVKE